MGEGDLFTSGGWTGTVKRVYDMSRPSASSSDNSSASSSSVNSSVSSSQNGSVYYQRMSAGLGVKCIVKLDDTCEDPRPLGELVYIVGALERDWAEYTADQIRMSYAYGTHLHTINT